jgi:hypothetical protein
LSEAGADLDVSACCSTSPISLLASFLVVSAVAAVVAGSGTLPRRSFLFPSIMGCLAIAKKYPAQRKIHRIVFGLSFLLLQCLSQFLFCCLYLMLFLFVFYRFLTKRL